MANITFNNQIWGLATYIPNEFIDKHMTSANGEYVKIYLYLLRYINHPEEEFSIGKIADHFDHTEKDVQRALAYWEKMNLLRLEYNEKKQLTGICLLNGQNDTYAAKPAIADKSSDKEIDRPTRIRAISIPQKATPSPDELKHLCQREDIQELVFLTETYLGRTISRSDLEYIFCWYDQLHFTPELIEFLIENTITKGHPSFHYMHKVAEDWYAQGISSLEEAKQLVSRNNEIYYAVLKGFGIRGRNLVPSEMDMLKKWTGTYGFGKDMIAEACKRTIANIHEPSFEYTDSILTNWHAASLHTLEDVKKADEAYAKQQNAARAKAPARSNHANKFNNFQQRDYDYDRLSQQLLEKSML
ncbi:MAG: DnaD domain protein [Eubacterium sp.]|nr:DnaD domain protein [Eubacterium sp.]